MTQRRLAEKVEMATDWLSTLDDYQVQYVVLDKGDDRHMLGRLRSAPGWVAEFEDGEAMLFARGGTTSPVQ